MVRAAEGTRKAGSATEGIDHSSEGANRDGTNDSEADKGEDLLARRVRRCPRTSSLTYWRRWPGTLTRMAASLQRRIWR